MEEVERVSGRVQRTAGGDEIPPSASLPGQQHGAANDQCQQQDVAEGISEVRRNFGGASARESLDAAEREGGAERGGSQAGDSAIEQERRRKSDHLPSHHQHNRQVGEGEERDVEGVRGRRRRSCAVL